jgi:myo-inositol-1(or 4)-monophosphatase
MTTTPGRLESELLGVALEAAAAAVDLIHTRRPHTFGIDAKSTLTDLVTEMDTASEALIRDVIGRRRPDDTVVGEEGGEQRASASGADATGVTWWVDPIDGTTNYVYDHPGYNVSIAAGVAGRTLVGVVADPTHGRTYSAVRGGGARCDEVPLSIGAAPPLERALVATGFAYDAGRRGRQGRVVAELLPQVRDIRRMGAAAMDLCSVASGRVDAYYEAGLSIWDLAAGALIAEEAGVRTGSLDGGPVRPESVLATHPDLFEPLRALLVGFGADRV